MASIQDVAKHAKVGVGTVSRVISENGYVSEETRQKVQKAINELNYKPNELARNLLLNRTNIIAVIIPDIANPFFAALVNEIERELRRYGYKTMLCNTAGEATNEQAYLDMLERNMVDGLLTGTHTLDTEIYRRVKRPIVAFDTPPLADGMPVITVNHGAGGCLAANALLQSGCKEVLQFTDQAVEGFPFIKRHDEFRRVAKEAGIICHDYFVAWNQFNDEYFSEIAADCFRMYPHVDGVFGTDILAMHFMKHALLNGKKIPEDICVVAYDGTGILDLSYPSASAVVQPIKDLARVGVDQLLSIIKGKKTNQSCIELDVVFRKGMTTI